MCTISLCLLGLALYFAIVSAAPYPVLPSFTSIVKAAKQPVSETYQTIAFKVPCARCLASGDDAVLDFEVQHPHSPSSTNLCAVPFALNGQPVTFDHGRPASPNPLQVSAGDWSIDLAVQTLCTTPGTDFGINQRVFFFNISQINDVPLNISDAFTVVLDQSLQTQVLIDTQADDQIDCADSLASVVDETSSLFTELDNIQVDDDLTSSTDIDFAEQILRRRLYAQAAKLRKLNEDCRKNPHQNLADCRRDFSPLTCVARVVSERIHDITSTRIKEIQESLKGSAMISKQRHEQYILADGNDSWNFPNVTSIENLFSSSKHEKSKDTSPQHPLVLALEILAAALGLAALCNLIRRRFCSLRRRVERLADREERKRAHQFRSLARREAFRKKWVSIKGIFKRKSRNGDYEEKRALIIEAAGNIVDDYVEVSYHSEDPEHPEDPEMGDAVGELRRAHEFVAAMVNNGRVHMRRSFDAGSRVSSLPSYTEEKLPDYTPTADSDVGVSNGFRYAPSLAGSGSVMTAITPDSSVVVTPRCSHETLRTGTDFSSD